MKQNLIRLSQQYVTALRKHLKQGPQASLRPALRMGREAVALGLETLNLARMHEQALATLELSTGKNGFAKLAEIFFTEANTLIEETHGAARRNQAQLRRLQETLGRRTEELAVRNRQLARGAPRCRVMADACEKSGRRHHKSLTESLQLQNRLRQLTHKVLAAQEDERKKISHDLQDEIAQTLLGINVRLISLKQRGRHSTRSLKNEIASTQRLVVNSARTVRRFARELKVRHPA